MDVSHVAGHTFKAAVGFIFLIELSFAGDFVEHSSHVFIPWLLEHLRIVVVSSDVWHAGVTLFALTNLVQYVVEDVLQLVQAIHTANFHAQHDLGHVDKYELLLREEDVGQNGILQLVKV